MEMFRNYYKRDGSGEQSDSTYKTCMSCEKINARFRYLQNKGTSGKSLTVGETDDLRKIQTLYELLHKKGLSTPLFKSQSFTIDLDAEITKHHADLVRLAGQGVKEQVPLELQEWLLKDLEDYDEDALESIGDELIAKYRPVLRLDENYNPVYNETYRDVLNQILKRFDDHIDG